MAEWWCKCLLTAFSLHWSVKASSLSHRSKSIILPLTCILPLRMWGEIGWFPPPQTSPQLVVNRWNCGWSPPRGPVQGLFLECHQTPLQSVSQVQKLSQALCDSTLAVSLMASVSTEGYRYFLLASSHSHLCELDGLLVVEWLFCGVPAREP